MKILAVIPSRYASSRFPGKPLARIAGQTMIERVYRQVEKAGCFSKIIVATDDERIGREVDRFKGNWQMTPSSLNSGSERVWHVLRDSGFDAAINIQGDEPLLAESVIAEAHQTLEHGDAELVSAVWRNPSYEQFLTPSVVKAVFDHNRDALFFSRSPIPYCDQNSFRGFFQHLGIYGYRVNSLRLFVESPPSDLERAEKLEQLRFLDLGMKIRLVISDKGSHGVDLPEDIARIEAILESEHA